MYVGRKFDELDNIPVAEWDIKELLYHHDMMDNLVSYLNAQGNSRHKQIIEEIEKRGGRGGDRGAWDHSSRMIYD